MPARRGLEILHIDIPPERMGGMAITPEQTEQSREDISRHEAEITHIRATREGDPQLKVNDTRAEDLEEKIVTEEIFLRTAEDEG